MKWEYTVIYLASFELSKETNSLVDALNEFGKMEWQLVAIDNGIIYLKRPWYPKSELTEGDMRDIAKVIGEAINEQMND